MKFNRETKIVFIILGLMLLVAAVLVIALYPRYESGKPPVDYNLTQTQNVQPPGTCAPDSKDCDGNPKLCMEENKNLTCN